MLSIISGRYSARTTLLDERIIIMIKHICMFKLKDAKRAEEAKALAEKLLPLVPSVRKMEVRINSDKAPKSNFELALICDFDDIKGLNEYQSHPEHKKFAAFISEIREENGRACIDFEYRYITKKGTH